MSWLVAFAYGLKSGGAWAPGVLALVGIACAHLATNLFDDYFDYKHLSFAQECKCALIKDGTVSHGFYLRLAIGFLAAAAAVGAVLTAIAGWKVILLAAAGGIIVLTYSPLSRLCLGEVAVLLAFGPLLFEGVYYVMTGGFSWEVLMLSLSVVMISIGLLYTHMLLDVNGDKNSHKKTLCVVLGAKAPWLLYAFYTLGYIFAAALKIWAVFLTLPFVIKLCRDLKTKDDFYPLFFQARNIITYFALIMTTAILLS
jgi:1,4-dihydroxy-2-naphthoate octaprenyltransferase